MMVNVYPVILLVVVTTVQGLQYVRRESLKAKHAKSGRTSLDIHIDIPGNIVWKSASSNRVHFLVTSRATEPQELDKVHVDFQESKEEITLHITSHSDSPIYAAHELDNGIGHLYSSPFSLFMIAGILSLLGPFQNHKILNLAAIFLLWFVHDPGGHVVETRLLVDKDAAVVVLVPRSFLFSSVRLHVSGGEIEVDSGLVMSSTPLECTTRHSDEHGCPLCCHGRGVCGEQNRCNCDEGYNGTGCEHQKTAEYTVYINPADIRLLSTQTTTGKVIDLYGKRRFNGTIKSLNAMKLRDVTGRHTTVKLGKKYRVKRITSSSGSRLNLKWRGKNRIYVKAITSDGQSQVNVNVRLKGSKSGKVHHRTKHGKSSPVRVKQDRYKLESEKEILRRMLKSEKAREMSTDTSTVAIGALNTQKPPRIKRDTVTAGVKGSKSEKAPTVKSDMNIGGRITNSTADKIVVDASRSQYLHIPVTVLSCGIPEPDAEVFATVYLNYHNGSWDGSAEYRALPTHVEGIFYIQIPNNPASRAKDNLAKACATIGKAALKSCSSVSSRLSEYEEEICNATAEGFKHIPEADPEQVEDVLQTCRDGFGTVDLHCRTLDFTPQDASIDISECEKVKRYDDSYTDRPIFVQPIAVYPDGRTMRGIGTEIKITRNMIYHEDGFVLDDNRGGVKLTDVVVEPSDPKPKERYKVRVSHRCASDKTSIYASVVGSDYYQNEETCIGEKSCNCCELDVAGAAELVVDSVEIDVVDPDLKTSLFRHVVVVF